jgi:U3 small nucleolar RNA-associated protein 14
LNNAEGSHSEVEEEGEHNEFFDVLDILDGRADPINDDEPSVAPPPNNEILRDSSEEGEQEQEVDSDGDDHYMDTEVANPLTPSDDEVNVDALHNLDQFISNLDSSSKRKNAEDEGKTVAENNVPRKKRRLLKERNEAGAENEFAASGELEYDQCSISPHSDTSALQARPNSISRIFSLRL